MMQASFFPSRTLSFYMARLFLVRTLAVLVTLVVVLQILDLLSESGKILAARGNGEAQLWTYVGLRLPELVQFATPFSVLLGTLVTLVGLNQNSEVISMKAAGLSAHQILAPLVLTSLVIAGASLAFNERIATRSTATLDRWQKVKYAYIPPASTIQMDVWVREGNNLIHADLVQGHGDGVVLKGITVYNRKGDALQSMVKAQSATYTGNAWRLTGANRFDVQSGDVSALGDITAGQGIPPDQFGLSKVDPDGMDFFALKRAIEDLETAGRPTNALRSDMWHKLSGPFSAVLMPILAGVAAFGLARSGALVIRAVIGMACGFAYFVADNFALAMGSMGAYPAWLAAWGPFALFLLIGETMLIKTEE